MGNAEYRIEYDLVGKSVVPADMPYGVHTVRAVENFPLRGEKTIGDYRPLIQGLMFIKKAAAKVNGAIGLMDEKCVEAIIKSADSIIHDYPPEWFPVHRFHGGGGTSANMNANEVLANLGEETLGGSWGQYRLLHPNNQVNLNQSTNDVYPTACHIAVILKWQMLKEELQQIIKVLEDRSGKLGTQKRIARTCLQDAVSNTFGDLLGGYGSFFLRAIDQIQKSIDNLYFINLGGTIIGRKEDVPAEYLNLIIPAIQEISGDNNYRQSADLFDAAQNCDDMARLSSELCIMARGFIKICKDFRLMNSGPETGFNEIQLPALQAGSSIMPGKVNPVIPEFAIQLCFQTIGLDSACQRAVEHGEMDLNIWESLLVFSILDAMDLQINALNVFSSKCLAGFQVNAEVNRLNTDSTIPLLTELMKKHSYSVINDIYKESKGDVIQLKKLLKDNNIS